ncbi:MAG: Asp-tRNA(Asn)/Glu-tRNA(Gln) amidotransferase subunit GatA [Deltaproteobacteria bacterium]|nr:Asp-tRNA(Asn)/Glu-tRNA(Gln) amidotransferase subunit GatA [Deltaproteobacteria bacterium]
MTTSLTQLTIHESHERLKTGDVTSEELTQAYIKRIEAVDPQLNCYLTRVFDSALLQAKKADAQLKQKSDVTPLTGIPLALKDIFITKGIRTTCASKLLDNYIPPYNSTVAEKLDRSGAVLLGKLNMDEFAMGSSNEHSAYGPVKNPWDLTRTPGGSSGGSAAAIAADLCAGTFGTDTGGSIRQPAAMCGIVGMKPTYGRVSRYGIIAFASSLDQVGPMAKDVMDCALLLNAITGHDARDATSIAAPVPDYTHGLQSGIKGLTIGVPREYFIDGIDPQIENHVRSAIDQLKLLGANIVEISLPHTEYAVPVYYTIAPAEASSNLARYDGVRYGKAAPGAVDLADLFKRTRTEGFGPEVTLRIIIGTFVLSAGYYDAYYLKAQKVRTLIKQDFLKAFHNVDAIVAPTAPTAAFKLGEKSNDPLQMYLNDIFTIPANLAGLPGISLPCGLTENNLPIGLQLIGKPLDEATLLRIAYAYEQSTEWHTKKPSMQKSDAKK